VRAGVGVAAGAGVHLGALVGAGVDMGGGNANVTLELMLELVLV
jgi:hypothetical protein